MLIPLLSFIFATFFPILLLIVTLITSFHTNKDREKCSPFECGFDPLATARLPFSLRFFLLAVIFLVFDIEIVLLMPAVVLNSIPDAVIGTYIFLLILLLGLFHEWNEGSLDWT